MNRFLLFFILTISLYSCHNSSYLATNHIDASQSKMYDTAAPVNSSLDSLIRPFRTEFVRKMSDTLAFNPTEMAKSRGESLLGNWACDAIAWYCDSILHQPIDIAVTNLGGLRVRSLSPGVITLKSIFELMPFENALTLITVDSMQMNQFLIAISKGGGWPISHTLKLYIQNGNSLQKWSIDRKTIAPNFVIATTDYVAKGGDYMEMLVPLPQREMNVKFRDIFIEYAKYQKTLLAKLENRIIKIQ